MITPLPPRPAATVLLLRDGMEGLEVFMVVRHRALAFASGAMVFPGGSVEEHDWVLAGGAAARALRVAAIRETWEECGVLLARPGGPLTPAAGPFAALLAERGLMPDLEALVPFAHWITPEAMEKRYDTHFFLAALPPGQAAHYDGREAIAGMWIRPQVALAEAAAGRYKLLFPTRLNLSKLARSGSVAEALAAARARPVVTVLPQMRLSPAGRILRIPPEADYGGEEFVVADPSAP